jgi:hypothetical protein
MNITPGVAHWSSLQRSDLLQLVLCLLLFLCTFWEREYELGQTITISYVANPETFVRNNILEFLFPGRDVRFGLRVFLAFS